MMRQRFSGLSETKTLWSLFILTACLTAGFGLAMHIGEFGIIDEMYDAEHIRAHIAAMTPQQRTWHIWTTATLDVAYPFAYGGLFIGLALRAFKRRGAWLALPSLHVIPADLTEGFAQVMLLSGHDNFMGLKLVATPIKLGLFGAGLMISIVAVAVMMRKRGAE